MDEELKKRWEEFTKALVPFKGYFKEFFTDEKLEEIEKKLEMGAKLEDELKDAVKEMKYECNKLKKAAKNLSRRLY